MKKLNLFLLFLLLPHVTTAESIKSLVLYYDEFESGVGGQTMRYIINDQYLRIDGGHKEDDFILYDRASKTVYSTNQEDQTILKIVNKPWSAPAFKFDVEIRESVLSDAPKVFGKKVSQYQVTANNEVCTQVLYVADMHPVSMKVMHEYQDLMSGQQVATLDNTPKEMQSPCFLVDQVFHHANYFEKGLPIQISYSRDYTKLLKSIRQQDIDPGLFILPTGFKEYLPYSH